MEDLLNKENSFVVAEVSVGKVDLKRSAVSPLAPKTKRKARDSQPDVPFFNLEQLQQLLVPPTPLETIELRYTNMLLAKQTEVQSKNIEFLELERRFS